MLSVPTLIGIGIGVSFIRSGSRPLSLLTISFIACVLGYIVCIVALNVKFYASSEHKQLDRSFGPPLIIVAWMFFLWTALYVQVNRMSSHWLIGILLPIGAWITRVIALLFLSRSCHFQYYVPKAASIEAVANAELSNSEAPPPPLLGDVEAIYGYVLVLFALLIGCGSYASMLVEVLNNPESSAWVTGIATGAFLEVMDRTSITQRYYYCLPHHRVAPVCALLVPFPAKVGG
jgi:hypothetical protein